MNTFKDRYIVFDKDSEEFYAFDNLEDVRDYITDIANDADTEYIDELGIYIFDVKEKEKILFNLERVSYINVDMYPENGSKNTQEYIMLGK